jgi:hypothetical protein
VQYQAQPATVILPVVVAEVVDPLVQRAIEATPAAHMMDNGKLVVRVVATVAEAVAP